ncbi:MAG: penicillin-binding transpeptidase domain-containing protein [Bacteroidota bacterium]
MRGLFPLLFLLGCTELPDEATAPPEPVGAPADSAADLSSFFPEGTEGTFVLYDAQGGVTTRHNPERAAERVIPASTFKIFNSLVVLDAGAVADEHEVVAWDGAERAVPGWNASQDLETAFARSSVWVYRDLARRAGRGTLQAALDREGYGNATIGDQADLFWLDGSLRIAPNEQIDFLRRLRAGETGFSDRAEAIVSRIMVVDTTGEAVLRGKTGWARSDSLNLGWWVGWLERADDAYFFALLVESEDPDFDMVGARRPTADRILRHLGIR